MLSFGGIGVVIVGGLLPNQDYNFGVQHICRSSPATHSSEKTKSGKTLAKGNLPVLSKFHHSLVKNMPFLVKIKLMRVLH